MLKSAGDMVKEAQSKINCIDVNAAKSLYKSADRAFIIDVRESSSAETCKLKDSINIPRGLIEMKIQKHCLDPDDLILIHCAGGGRASLSALTLQHMGYTNVNAITAKYEDIKNSFDNE